MTYKIRMRKADHKLLDWVLLHGIDGGLNFTEFWIDIEVHEWGEMFRHRYLTYEFPDLKHMF